MPEIVSCPNCRRRSRLPDALIGKKVKCPECKEVFTAAVAGPPPAKTEAVKSKRDEADPGYEVVDEDEDEPEAESESEAETKELSELDELRTLLDQAVAQEHYEEAARLRDRIKKLEDEA